MEGIYRWEGRGEPFVVEEAEEHCHRGFIIWGVKLDVTATLSLAICVKVESKGDTKSVSFIR